MTQHPIDQQAFTADEVAAMRHALDHVLRTHVLRTKLLIVPPASP